MPQPAAASALADELVSMFQTAQRNIEQQLASITDGRRAGRLRELQRTAIALVDQLERNMRIWIEQTLPQVYEFGATEASGIIGDAFVWTQPHVAALQQLATATWDDLLSATRFVRRDVKAWIRDEARHQATLSLIEGRTARQAGAALADAAGSELGLFTVTYRNGARVRLGDYAEMALRTTTAKAYNDGTIVQTSEAGVLFVEVADGDDCGLNGHDDPEKPNGKVYPLDFVASFSLSHPNCRRSFIPRPDANSREAASLRTEASRSDQRLFEQVSRTSHTRRPQRAARAARSAR